MLILLSITKKTILCDGQTREKQIALNKMLVYLFLYICDPNQSTKLKTIHYKIS